VVVTERELELRRAIFLAFAATGAPPPPAFYAAKHAELAVLGEEHVVVLRHGRIWAAHPFAAHQERARVRNPDGREWWGNCAWDALGIVAALGLGDATVDADGVTLDVRGGEVAGDAWFHVAVPAADWWADIEFT
jgi:hypothetical protein